MPDQWALNLENQSHRQRKTKARRVATAGPISLTVITLLVLCFRGMPRRNDPAGLCHGSKRHRLMKRQIYVDQLFI